MQQEQIKEPIFFIDNRFAVKNLTPERREEAFEVFSKGYYHSNHIFKQLQYTQDDIKEFIAINTPHPYGQHNFTLQVIVVDTHNNDKIIGFFNVKDTSLPSNWPKNITPGMKLKRKIDNDLNKKIPQEDLLPGLSSTGCFSLDPDYQANKIGLKAYYMYNYLSRKSGYKYAINVIYNKNSAKLVLSTGTVEIMNELGLQNEELNGVKIFQHDDNITAYSIRAELNEKFFKPQKNFTIDFRQRLDKFFEESIQYYDQTCDNYDKLLFKQQPKL